MIETRRIDELEHGDQFIWGDPDMQQQAYVVGTAKTADGETLLAVVVPSDAPVVMS